MYLNPYIFKIHILPYLDVKDKYTQVIFYPKLLEELLTEFRINKEKTIQKYFTQELISKLGLTYQDFLDYPWLEFNESFCPGDYIDNIKLRYIRNPITLTIDNYRRPAIILRYSKFFKWQGLGSSQGWHDKGIETIFQRYTNNKIEWTNGTFYNGFIREPRITKWENLGKLMKDKKTFWTGYMSNYLVHLY